MTKRADIVEKLAVIRDGKADDWRIADVLVLIGALDRPTLPVERYHRHLTHIATKVGKYARVEDGPVPADEMADALKQILMRHYGYGAGEHTTDEDCFDLTRVIDSRVGAGETLTILYLDAARQLGWTVEAIKVPGRLLVRLESEGERVIIDPLGDARPLEPADIRALIKAYGGNDAELTPDSLEPLSDMALLLRTFAAKKALLLREKREEERSSGGILRR